jgi:hypothetical protein
MQVSIHTHYMIAGGIMSTMIRSMAMGVLLLVLAGSSLLYAQTMEFETGKIGVQINEYGRVRIHAPLIGDLQQIDRSSILVGAASGEVFDYRQDADLETEPTVIESPELSDFEIFSAINNAYSELPPDVVVKINAHGWDNEGYIIVKFTVINREAAAIDAVIGMEIHPRVDGTYGNESVEFLTDDKTVAIYRDATHIGFTFLSSDIISLKLFEWSEGFDNDTGFYEWLTHGEIDASYTAEGDGAVIIPAQESVSIASGDSTVLYVGIAVGDSNEEMVTNIQAAKARYESLTSVQPTDRAIPDKIALKQNYPNPFNPSTSISFSIPDPGHVTLRVYSILGETVATLVNENLSSGNYTVNFDARSLPSGMYFYTLSSGSINRTKKMVLIR